MKPAPGVVAGTLEMRLEGSWEKIARPSATSIEDAPLGTAYRGIHHSRRLAKWGNAPEAHVYVKIAPNRWVFAATDVDVDAITELVSRMHAVLEQFPHYQDCTDEEIPKLLDKTLTRWDAKKKKEIRHADLFGARVGFSSL